MSGKMRFTHTEKALIIALFIELGIIFLLFNVGFKENIPEETYAVDFVDEDFDFEELKPDEKIELPDVQKYINQHFNTNVASNQLQEDKSFEEFRKQQEEAVKTFEKSREEWLEKLKIKEESKTPKEEEKNKKETRFTGRSNIEYFIKDRKDLYMANPLYTCPDYMKGLIVIDIEVDQNGNVVTAKYNKNESGVDYKCLIETAIQAAYESFFNSDPSAPALQKGIITYNFY
jgi:hypothetical protein